MAKIVERADRHDCQAELRRDLGALRARSQLPPGVGYGDVAECSCGKRFQLADEQRDGPYWREIERR